MNIEELIAAANPVPAASVPTGDSPAARQTLAAVVSEPPGRLTGAKEASGRATGRLRPLVLGGLASAAAFILVVALVVLGAPGKPRHAGPRPDAMVTALDALAIVAAAQPVTHPLRHGQFQYTASTSLNWVDTINNPKDSYNVSYIERRQVWIALNGKGRIKESYSDPDLAPQDVAGWIAAGRPSLRVPSWDQRFGRHQLSIGPTNLLKLPTNPVKLAALLFARKIEGGPPGPAEDFVQIGDLLRETDAPPALRAAIFKVAERIPGTKLLGTVTDQAGASGVAIARWQRLAAHGPVPAQVDESVLIFASRTSALLAEETFVTYAKTGKTVLTSWTDYLKSGVVNSVSSTTLVAGSSGGGGSGPA
jgi:hypothetical protein